MTKTTLYIIAFILTLAQRGLTQDLYHPEVPPQKETHHSSEVWLGIYTKYRIGEKLFYYGEYHLRHREWWSEMSQLYLRFGLSYLVNKSFEFTGGIVTPFYYAKGEATPEINHTIPQFRFWEQLLFLNSYDRLKIYHQIRLEQRWRKDHALGSEYRYDWRMRYKIAAYYPLNKEHLESGAIFLCPSNEIFMQAGKHIIYNNFEDNRFFLGMGYILNDEWQFQAGYLHSYKHDKSPFAFNNRHILRVAAFHNLDFFGKKHRGKIDLPPSH